MLSAKNGGDDHHQAEAHVEDLIHFGLLDFAQALHPGEDRRDGPAAALDDDLHALRNDAGQIFVQSAAGDVGDAVHHVLHAIVVQHLPDRLGVEDGRLQKRFADRAAEFFDVVADGMFGDVEHDFPREAVAVGMQARRGDADDRVARLDRAAVDDVPLLDHAHAKAGQIVIAGGVEVGQDRGFAAQQRAIALNAAVGDAFDDLLQAVADRPWAWPRNRGRTAVPPRSRGRR